MLGIRAGPGVVLVGGSEQGSPSFLLASYCCKNF